MWFQEVWWRLRERWWLFYSRMVEELRMGALVTGALHARRLECMARACWGCLGLVSSMSGARRRQGCR